MEITTRINLEETLEEAISDGQLEMDDIVTLLEMLMAIPSTYKHALSYIFQESSESDLEDLVPEVEMLESQKLAMVLALMGEMEDVLSIARVYKESLVLYKHKDDGDGPLKGLI